MFDIRFLDSEPEPTDEGGFALRGRVVLGDYAEEILAYLGPWDRSDYERQWTEAAQRLSEGAPATGFFTSRYQFWWVMWREGEEVFAQERVLVEDTLREPWDPSDPYRQIGERETRSDDGQRISQWKIRLDDVRDSARRRAAEAS